VILADTNIWIGHFRRRDDRLLHHLSRVAILIHSMVLCELACGSLPSRATTLAELGKLPRSAEASHAETMAFIGRHGMFALGMGFPDAHLLAAIALTPGGRLWTRDAPLDSASERLGLRHIPDA
jgi:predicted nucleic acid-binding protein